MGKRKRQQEEMTSNESARNDAFSGSFGGGEEVL